MFSADAMFMDVSFDLQVEDRFSASKTIRC